MNGKREAERQLRLGKASWDKVCLWLQHQEQGQSSEEPSIQDDIDNTQESEADSENQAQNELNASIVTVKRWWEKCRQSYVYLKKIQPTVATSLEGLSVFLSDYEKLHELIDNRIQDIAATKEITRVIEGSASRHLARLMSALERKNEKLVELCKTHLEADARGLLAKYPSRALAQAFASKVEDILSEASSILAEHLLQQEGKGGGEREKRVEVIAVEKFMADIHRTTRQLNQRIAEKLEATQQEALRAL